MINWFIERRKESRRRKKLYENVVSEIPKLSPNQAKGLFIKISETFSDEFLIKSDDDDGTFEEIKHLLPRYLKDYYKTFPSVDFSWNEYVISRNFIKPSELHSDCLCIGDNGPFGEIVIIPEKEEVYVLYSEDTYTEICECLKDGAKSIYNFILEMLCVNEKICEYVKKNLEIT